MRIVNCVYWIGKSTEVASCCKREKVIDCLLNNEWIWNKHFFFIQSSDYSFSEGIVGPSGAEVVGSSVVGSSVIGSSVGTSVVISEQLLLFSLG